MADAKPGLKPITEASKEDKADVADPSGKVSNTEGSFGTRQQEPNLADYPLSSRITPTMHQLNPASASSVGPMVGDVKSPDLAKAAEAQTKAAASGNERAAKIADLKREMSGEVAEIAAA